QLAGVGGHGGVVVVERQHTTRAAQGAQVQHRGHQVIDVTVVVRVDHVQRVAVAAVQAGGTVSGAGDVRGRLPEGVVVVVVVGRHRVEVVALETLDERGRDVRATAGDEDGVLDGLAALAMRVGHGEGHGLPTGGAELHHGVLLRAGGGLAVLEGPGPASGHGAVRVV